MMKNFTLLLILTLFIGCSSVSNQDWKPIGWDNINSTEGVEQKPFEPIYSYDPLTNNVSKIKK